MPITTIMENGKDTGLRDLYGKHIKIGDKLKFVYKDGCSWIGTVIYEDGVVTVATHNAIQIRNPKWWKQKYNWIDSRWWSSLVGYGEYGSWNCPRQPLTHIAEQFRHFKAVERLHEKYGWCERILKVIVVDG